MARERVKYDIQPGQVWQWDGNNEVFYILSLKSRHCHGQHWHALSERTGMPTSLFFRFERFNGWERIA